MVDSTHTKDIPFKYTGPGYYVTRDGRKVLVGKIKDQLHGLMCDTPDSLCNYTWTMDGTWMYSKMSTDLVGPWIDWRPVDLWLIVDKYGTIKYTSQHEHRTNEFFKFNFRDNPDYRITHVVEAKE